MIRCTFCGRKFELSELTDAILFKSGWGNTLYQFSNGEVHQFKLKDLKREPIRPTQEIETEKQHDSTRTN